MSSFVLQSSARQGSIYYIMSRYFVLLDGTLCLAVTMPSETDKFASYVRLDGKWQGHFIDGRGGQRAPSGIPIDSSRVDIEVRHCETRIAQDVRIGSLVVTEKGICLVAKSWNEDEVSVAVNIESGQFQTLDGTGAMVIDSWVMRAYQEDTLVFRVEVTTPTA